MVCTAVLVFSIVRFLHSTDTKHQILYLGIFVLALATQVLMKLWYWVMNTKLSVLRELKQLRLAMPVAEDSESSSVDVDTAAEERVTGLSKPERRIWWIFLLAVALGIALLSSL